MKSTIRTYSDFALNETLKSHNIDIVIRKVKMELSRLRYNFYIKKEDRKISIQLLNFNTVFGVGLYLDNLDSLMIDRHGWFPSYMTITNFSGQKRTFPYDENKLLDDNDNQYYEEVEIFYEARYDIETQVPDKLYHVSIQEFESNILKRGLICKSKLKISNHLDRIYVCSDIQKCYNLIPRMRFIYTNKKINNKLNKINDKWIIYEIDSSQLDIKLYKDPNYEGGYYIVENIPREKIQIIDKEI